jgi:hypothetical protein
MSVTTQLPDLQTELLPAVPLYRWVDTADETHHYVTVGSEAGPTTGNWELERSAGNVPLQPLAGALQVYAFVNSDLDYYLSTTNVPPAPSGWTAVNQAPWYVFDPTLPPPPGTVELDCWTDGSHYFYTADPEIENLGGWTKSGTLGYIYKVPMAVYRWTNSSGYHYWSTNPNATAPNGFTLEGKMFYAFVNPAPQTVPIYSYTGQASGTQDQYFDVIPNHSRPGWTQDPNPAFYAFPNNSAFFGATPLQHYQSQTANFFTANPTNDNLNGFTYCDNLVQVFPATQNGMPPTINANITAGTLITTGAETQRSANALTADTDYIDCSVHWYGLLLELSHQATADIGNGLNVAAAVSAAVAAVTAGANAVVGAAVGVVSGYLWAVGSGLQIFDRGNGVDVRIPWWVLAANIEPAIILVSVLPWPHED